MNTIALDNPNDSGESQDSTARALTDYLQLSTDELQKIYATMQQDGLSFPEAAIKLHLATNEQVAAAVAAEARKETLGIIESARRKVLLASRRQAELKEPDEFCQLGPKLIAAHDAYSPHSEKLRGLRTELALRFSPSSLATTLAVVSAGNGDGRSQMAAELAIAFAQMERRTLLIDGDLRSPSLNKLFNCGTSSELSQALADGSSPTVLGVTGIRHLHLITSGTTPSNPLELLSGKRLEQLLHGWRLNYDFIIVDTPPVAKYADALTIVTLVKLALIVMRANHSKLQETKEMLRRLSITRAELLGSVLNHF